MGDLSVSLHGPGVTIDDMVGVAPALKSLLGEIGRELDAEVEWQIVSVQFRCDGCGLTRPDRPAEDEGWTYRDGDDLCPSCSGEWKVSG